MKHKLILLAFSFFLSLSAMAQDTQFSQYYAVPLNLNPALAGSDPDYRLTAIHRAQWKSIAIPYVSKQISLIVPFHHKKLLRSHFGGAGLAINDDKAGAGNFKTLGVNASLAYNVYLSSNNMISFGLQGGIIQKSVDINNLEWGSSFTKGFAGFDPSVPADQSDISNKTFADAGAGFVLYNNKLKDYEEKKISSFLGLSVYHLNTPNESLLKGSSSALPRLYKLHSGLEWNINEKFNISPNLLALSQNKITQINAGVYLTYRLVDGKNFLLAESDLIVGTWYRLKDAFIISTGLHTKYYTLGFSYDLNNSSLRYSTKGRGAYEISLSLSKPSHKLLKRYSTPRI